MMARRQPGGNGQSGRSCPCRCFAAGLLAQWPAARSQGCSLQACRPRPPIDVRRLQPEPRAGRRRLSRLEVHASCVWSHAGGGDPLGPSKAGRSSLGALRHPPARESSWPQHRISVAAGPVGPPVEPLPSGRAPGRAPLQGRYVRLEPVDVPAHAPSLYALSHARPEDAALWTYLAYGPFPDQAAFAAWLAERARSDDPLFFAIIEPAERQGVGHGELSEHRAGHGLHRDRPHLVRAALAEDPGGDRGDLPDDAPRVRRPRLSPPGVEVQCAERGLDARRAPLRLHLRGHVPPAHGGQGAQPRHRLVLAARSRMARRARRLRALAGTRELRRRRADSGCRLPRSCRERDRFEGTPQCAVTLSVL